MAAYAYGDDANALDRLRLLARVFRPSSAALLRRLSTHQPRVILDLGCGPGHTTRLLHERFPEAGTTVGLDASERFIAAAKGCQPPALRFEVQDVSTVPLSRAPADLIYARLLLAHLRDATRLVADWSTQLGSGGLLVLEEIEDIQTEDALFQAYLEVAAAPLVARGTDLFIGRALAHMAPVPGTTVAHCEIALLRPRIGDVAAMFRLNLATLRHDKAVRSRYRDDELDAIAATLAARSHADETGAITWRIRQLVLKRTSGDR